MADRMFQVTVLTPHETMLEVEAVSLRLPAETGQVGLRPGAEPTVLAVEAGLALIRTPDRVHYVGTPGGLLRCDGKSAQLLTPFCVLGSAPREVAQSLREAVSQPREEMRARKALETLEERILSDLRSSPPQPAGLEARRP